MPKIVLCPMRDAPPLEGGVCVGTIDGEPLCYVGRVPHAGTVPLEHADIAQDLLAAVEAVATPFFGGDWLRPLATVAGLHERTVQRDRIAKFGLPPGVLRALGEAAQYVPEDGRGRALGHLMQGVAWLYHNSSPGEKEQCRNFLQPDREGLDGVLPLAVIAENELIIAMKVVTEMIASKPPK